MPAGPTRSCCPRPRAARPSSLSRQDRRARGDPRPARRRDPDLALATETAGAIFGFGTYRGASRRLAGLAWSSEDLSAELGAETNRDAAGGFTRHTCWRAISRSRRGGGARAGDRPVFPNFRDMDGLREEAEAARRDGYTAKIAIHPDQVPVINEVFTPTAEAIAKAQAIVDAFAADPAAGVVAIDGEMLDRPHLTRAQRLLARVKPA